MGKFGAAFLPGAATIAAIVAYGIGHALGPVTIYKLIGQKTEQTVESLVKRYGFWGIIAARVSPALSTDAASYAAGLLKMSFWRFLLATAIGIFPLIALISFLGTDIERLGTTLIWVSIISIVIFISYVVYDQVIRQRGNGSSTSEA
jgi:uncharacterized membrane protein YdjX (TVP38/TMEM64 family)